MSAGKLLSGVLVGAAAGAVLGLLYAPESGKGTRKKLAKKGGDLGDSVKSKFNELGEALQERYDTIKKDAKKAIKKAKNSSNDMEAEVEAAMS